MYNRQNLLSEIVEIQNVVLEHLRRGASHKWIYYNIIAPKHHISRSTYYRYLSINAKKQLKELKTDEKV